jgi:hypothetical protein
MQSSASPSIRKEDKKALLPKPQWTALAFLYARLGEASTPIELVRWQVYRALKLKHHATTQSRFLHDHFHQRPTDATLPMLWQDSDLIDRRMPVSTTPKMHKPNDPFIQDRH